MYKNNNKMAPLIPPLYPLKKNGHPEWTYKKNGVRDRLPGIVPSEPVIGKRRGICMKIFSGCAVSIIPDAFITALVTIVVGSEEVMLCT